MPLSLLHIFGELHLKVVLRVACEASILKLLRQKVDIETVQGLQALIEERWEIIGQ